MCALDCLQSSHSTNFISMNHNMACRVGWLYTHAQCLVLFENDRCCTIRGRIYTQKIPTHTRPPLGHLLLFVWPANATSAFLKGAYIPICRQGMIRENVLRHAWSQRAREPYRRTSSPFVWVFNDGGFLAKCSKANAIQGCSIERECFVSKYKWLSSLLAIQDTLTSSNPRLSKTVFILYKNIQYFHIFKRIFSIIIRVVKSKITRTASDQTCC